MSDDQPPPAHGTYAALMRHRRRQEPACDDCRRAGRDYMRHRRQSRPEVRAQDIYWNATRRYALEQLATEFPTRFSQILDEIRGSHE